MILQSRDRRIIQSATRQVIRDRRPVAAIVWGPIIAALVPLIVDVVAQLIQLWLQRRTLQAWHQTGESVETLFARYQDQPVDGDVLKAFERSERYAS